MESTEVQGIMFQKHQKRGLTLIELLVVVLILTTLALLAIPPMLNARLRAEVARVQQDLQVIESALEWYYLDNKRYPDTKSGSLANTSDPAGSNGLLGLMEPVRYLDRSPDERFSQKSLMGGSGELYSYYSNRVDGNASSWIVASKGPDGEITSRRLEKFPFGTVALEYNPTNGLRSEGDLIRYGGAWSEGSWYLNRQRMGRSSAQ